MIRASRRGACLGLALLVSGGCRDAPEAPRQLLVFIDTDAPLPPSPGQLAVPGEPPPLFDTLLVTVEREAGAGPCEQCSRTFPLDRERMARVEASFGVPWPDGTVPRIQLRLYDSKTTLNGTVPLPNELVPIVQSVIDVTVDAPETDQGGVIEAYVMLPVEQVGMPLGPGAARLTLGKPEGSQVGTWAGAARTGCAQAPLEHRVCIPGGAFWMGDPRARGGGIGDANNLRRLVVVDPFFMDEAEVTVADYRGSAAQASYPATAWSGSRDGTDWRDFCTFTAAPDVYDDLPVTCVPIEGARAFCAERSGTLPTEAQFEYVAGALASRQFVWGSDEPACDDAVLLRWGAMAPPAVGPIPLTCPPKFLPGSPDVIGPLVDPPRRDRLELTSLGGDGVVFDLVGNVAEWVDDDWNRQTEPCWSKGGVHRNPLCREPSPTDGNALAFRGGSWIVGSRQATAASRGGPLTTIAQGQGIDLGFRCVYPATL